LAAINVLCKIVSEKNCDQNDSIRPVIAITREDKPLVEWHKNSEIIAGSFLDHFLMGKGLPTGIFTQSLWDHLGQYYDGRFDDPRLISTGFNQIQRSACICKSAQVNTKQSRKLKALGELENNIEFCQILNWARDNPLSADATILIAKVCRILSMVGSNISFSPFYRASTRSKLAAMRYRYGLSSIFIRGAPHEFEDLALL
jgi:hypothetical protein